MSSSAISAASLSTTYPSQPESIEKSSTTSFLSNPKWLDFKAAAKSNGVVSAIIQLTAAWKTENRNSSVNPKMWQRACVGIATATIFFAMIPVSLVVGIAKGIFGEACRVTHLITGNKRLKALARENTRAFYEHKSLAYNCYNSGFVSLNLNWKLAGEEAKSEGASEDQTTTNSSAVDHSDLSDSE